MTDPNTAVPPALRRALELLTDPPAEPDVSKGYLDLLHDSAVPKNTGAIQALWASPIGSLLYDNARAVSRRLLAAWQHSSAISSKTRLRQRAGQEFQHDPVGACQVVDIVSY